MTTIIEQDIVERWVADIWEDIEKASAAQSVYVAESPALSVICGSIIQVAAMGIHLYSKNQAIDPSFHNVIPRGSKVARYSSGREVRTVPIGLIIYAARNQYNHMDDDALRRPSTDIFERLACNVPNAVGARDPAFDLSKKLLGTYAVSVVALLGWESYDDYSADLLQMMSTRVAA